MSIPLKYNKNEATYSGDHIRNNQRHLDKTYSERKGKERELGRGAGIKNYKLSTFVGDLQFETFRTDGIESELNQYHNYGVAYKNEDYINFNRFYTINPLDRFPSGRHYVFFCRPDLYLLDRNGKDYALSANSRVNLDPIFTELAYKRPELLQCLCAEFDIDKNGTDITTEFDRPSGSGYGNSKTSDGTKDMRGRKMSIHSLMPILTGRVESIQIPDFSIKTIALQQPYTKHTLPLSTTALESTTGGSFDIAFREDVNLSITKLFYAWVYYMDGVKRNVFSPKKKYSMYNAVDYATSIYDIVVKEDGESICWIGKYTGAFPNSVPISDWGFNKGSSPGTSVSINFQYFKYEAMNPEIVTDFNFNSLGYIYMTKYIGPPYNIYTKDQKIPYMASYNRENVFPGRSLVGRPFIEIDTNYREHKLKWMPPI